MIVGISTATFTLVHVAISLIGMLAGVVVLAAMIGSRRAPGWTGLFLVATIATSATGFLFPFKGFDPADGVGVISLAALAVAVLALYGRHLLGAWRAIYVIAALLAFYLNVFVGVVQAFQKVAALHALAPTGSEPPFLVAQVIVLAAFLVLGFVALKRFHPLARI